MVKMQIERRLIDDTNYLMGKKPDGVKIQMDVDIVLEYLNKYHTCINMGAMDVVEEEILYQYRLINKGLREKLHGLNINYSDAPAGFISPDL
jgi:hypothetical protein